MWIIGIHLGHDASVAVLKDGVPVFCLSEERLAREKGYYGFPFLALDAALNFTGIVPEDVAVLTLDTTELPGLLGQEEVSLRFQRGWRRGFGRHLHRTKKMLSFLFPTQFGTKEADRPWQAGEVLTSELASLGFSPDRHRIYDHHYCHAASAFWPSPFPEALFATSDGRGDGISASIGHACGGKLERRLSVGDTDSVGQFYAAVTFFLGFQPNRHEGKILGLAAHGDADRFGPMFFRHVEWLSDGSYRFRLPDRYRLRSPDELDEWARTLSLSLRERIILHGEEELDTLLYTANWYTALAYLADVVGKAAPEDVAAGVQYMVEEVCTRFVGRNLPNRPIPVVLAGGVFNNVRVNQKIGELEGVSGLYVQPAMGDEGLSLGSALLAFAEGCQEDASQATLSRGAQIGHTYLGEAYSDEEVLAAFRSEGVDVRKLSNIASRVAWHLHEGRVVGFFRGASEFGPRALGHRSILARPTDPRMPASLNERLRRTKIMPFAPSILAEVAGDYLVDYGAGQTASEYMTTTYTVFPERRSKIPAVIHIDGTTRPHVVHRHREAIYHRVLAEYYALSGIPLVLNTSFNRHEEPIVGSPRDAIRAFKEGCVDVLVVESFIAE